MKDLGGRWRVATVMGALAVVGGVSGAMAQQTSPVSGDRGRQGPEALIRETSRQTEKRTAATATPAPVAAEVKMLAVTGTVVSVDRESRDVTLRDDEGSEFTVQVPADATNLDQLKEGDRINVNILQPLELESPTPEQQ